jgi:FtsP/CotA-like multicopper oxidase with cupredoxin domain
MMVKDRIVATATTSSNEQEADDDRSQLLSQPSHPQRSNQSKRVRSTTTKTKTTTKNRMNDDHNDNDDHKEAEDKEASIYLFTKTSRRLNGNRDENAIDENRRRRIWLFTIGLFFFFFFFTMLVAADHHRTAVRRRKQNFPASSSSIINNNNGTMVTVPWIHDDSEPNLYRATIEFCQRHGNDNNEYGYGYRLPTDNTTTDHTACHPAGIVLRLQPGSQYALQVCNRADNTAAITNLHFHGLHIPNDTSDPVAPGQCNEFVLGIPETHMGGTFYFHSHAHPHSYEQVAGGAYSMLIVEEQANVLENVVDPKETSQIANWIQNERLLLVSSHVQNDDNSQPPHQQKYTVLGNGIPGGMTTLNIDAKTWYRFRIAAVDPTGQRQILKFPKGCVAHPVAFDGIWRHSISSSMKTDGRNLKTIQEFSLTGASRIDLAVRCQHSGEYKITWADAPVATIHVIDSKNNRSIPPNDASPFLRHAAWRPSRPEYLRDLSTLNDNDDKNEEELHRFNVPALHDRSHGFGDNAMGTPLLEMPLHSLQEWKILQSQHHPFHLHVFPMQTFGCHGHVDGEFYDTIMSTLDNKNNNNPVAKEEEENCRVRFRIDVPGPIMMHCHSLSDTDAGNGMAVMKVVDTGKRV